MRLYINGFATIMNSKHLPEWVKEQILKTKKGKIKRIVAKFTDSNGVPVKLIGKLERSKNGSLMARCTMQVSSCEIVEIDDIKNKEVNNQKNELLDKFNIA